jgi:hypothetical protein
VVQDRQGSGTRRKKRTTGDNRLSPPTVAKRVSVAKQVFRCAVRWEWLEKSPFDGLRPGSQANPARACYVPLETIRDVIETCPTSDWRLIVALARLAGLRCPSEIGSLTWASVNWEKGRLTVLAKKTEHHGGDHAMRVVPICPGLRAILAEAFELAEPGTELVVPTAARKGVNVRTHLERIIVKAGHKPWPRLLQNLRASCETDWVERFPAHVVAKWLGHSPKVAAQHYLMAREHHFEVVVGGGEPASPQREGGDPARVGATPDAGQGGPEPSSADCSALVAQIAAQQAAAAKGTPRHETTEPAATTGFAAGSSEVTPHSKSGVMAGAGHEQPAFHAGNPAVASVRCRSVLRSRRGRQEMRYRRAAWTRARLQHISPRMNRAEARPSPEPVFRAPHERPICGYTFDKRRILLHVGFARRRPRFRRLRVVRMRASGL